MNLILDRLLIENFKGIQHAEYHFSMSTKIRGRNASGKSSIVDAFCWLMFNKDSRGNAPGSDDFHEKPLDADGNEVHYLDTKVEADFSLDGRPFNLRRIQRENWVKPRGAMDAQYKGNASLYWINDVETKVKDFKARIDALASGDVFALISTLGAFNRLSDEKRRVVLLSMCGVDVDAELLSRSEFAAIADEAISLNVSMDDLRKVFSERKRRINQELTMIPARIDEAMRSKPEYTEDELRDAEYNLQDAREQLENCNRTLAKLESGDDSSAEIRRQILNLETQLVQEKQRISSDYQADAWKRKQRLDQATAALKAAEDSQARAERALCDIQDRVEVAGQKVRKLRAQYKERFAESFAKPEISETCPTCGQSVSLEYREKVAAAIKTEFEERKSAALKSIREQGKQAADELARLQEDAAAQETATKDDRARTMDAQKELSEAQDQCNLMPKAPDFDVPRIRELEAQIHDCKQKDHAAPDAKIAAAKERIRDLQARIDRASATLAKRDLAEKSAARIAELKEQQSSFGQKMADLEVKMFDLERFISERCKLLEDSINSLFPTVRWKLFNRQINGALVDCCECMMLSGSSLVSYSGNNTASCVNADIEIISVLQKHYGITVPVFVDNAERVNEIAIPSGQLITLSVSTDDELMFEHNDTKREAA